MRSIFVLAAIIALHACSPTQKNEKSANPGSEKYRPVFHFSPEKNWMNDPNGLIYLDGEYHLFYQYNPYANTWGHMSWGHAVSKDLLHWDHLPIALEEYTDSKSGDSVMVFSGSAVYDATNTSGYFKNKGGIVAIYTSHVHRNNEGILQHQSIAFSSDKGRSFTRFENNPVLNRRLKDFRDPKVFWFEPEKKWVMVVVVPDQYTAQFYESKNLTEWSFLSEFGPKGDTLKIWECPDLVQLPILGKEDENKWALLISNSNPQGPDFVGMQYFMGNFDGKNFVADSLPYPLYLEYGKDFYAAVTYNNVPDERCILLGWANNWAYGQSIPTFPWRSAMTLPRELYAAEKQDGFRIVQRPVAEIMQLRDKEITDFSAGDLRTIELEIHITPNGDLESGIKLIQNDSTQVVIGYDASRKTVFLDRTKSGMVDFHPLFASVENAPVLLQDGSIKLRVFIDRSIIEIFINDGEQVITDQFFPTSENQKIETFSSDGEASIDLRGWILKNQ